tara:strand:- start:130 stop:450 length:321 start_codon:yes stop_codon:yes gene_type:complete
MARRGSSISELQKKQKELKSKLNKNTAGEQYKTSVRNKNLNAPSKEGTKTTKSSGNFVTKNGKRYLKSSKMGKKIVADQKRKSLASKNYMSKEMIEKRKKRLKIKK